MARTDAAKLRISRGRAKRARRSLKSRREYEQGVAAAKKARILVDHPGFTPGQVETLHFENEVGNNLGNGYSVGTGTDITALALYVEKSGAIGVQVGIDMAVEQEMARRCAALRGEQEAALRAAVVARYQELNPDE